VKSLPKMDKSITCTVICDILWPIRLHFLQRQHQLYLIFLCFKCLKNWANLWLSVNVQKPKVFQLQGGFAPPNPLTTGSAPDPTGGFAPQTFIIGASHLYLGGLQLSVAGNANSQ